MSTTPLFEPICDGGHQLAIVVRHGHSVDKYNFATARESPLQLGVTFYRAGDQVPAHGHHPRLLGTRDCQELLLVVEGGIEVALIRNDASVVTVVRLGPGEAILLQQGAHAVRCLADTRLLEVKQGPYVSPDQDKYPVSGRSPGGA